MPDAMPAFLSRLMDVTNRHDLEALVDCFDPTYRNETPVHPGRDFQGAGQVRSNWRQVFTFVPDLQVDVRHWAVDDADVWSEWEMHGTRLDGTRHLMRGIIIFGVRDERATSARFYLEPVDESDGRTADDAVRLQVHADTP